MPVQTAIARPAKNVRSLDTNLYLISGKPILPVTANGDSQVLFTFPNNARLYGAHLTVPATLGAGVTVKLQKRDGTSGAAVDISAVSVAATAGISASTGLLPIDVKAGDTIEVLVAGGASAAAQIAYDLAAQHA